MSTETDVIRALVETRLRAVRAKDVDSLGEVLSPNLATFDVVEPMRRSGAQASLARAREWFGSFRDAAIGVETRDMQIFAGPDAAFAFYLVRFSGQQQTQKIDMWVRSTLGFAKLNGEWRLVHEHSSVPFNPATGQATLDGKP
jgi:ketosteroid isomerase-like protein